MAKLYKITRNPDALAVNIDDPSGHYYAEYISINDPDSGNPLTSDYGSAEEAKDSLDSLKQQFNLDQSDYLEKYYAQFTNPQSLENAKRREADVIAQYEAIKAMLPSLVVVECSLELKVKVV